MSNITIWYLFLSVSSTQTCKLLSFVCVCVFVYVRVVQRIFVSPMEVDGSEREERKEKLFQFSSSLRQHHHHQIIIIIEKVSVREEDQRQQEQQQLRETYQKPNQINSFQLFRNSFSHVSRSACM